MTSHDTLPTEAEGRFRTEVVLKQDVFSTVERGFFLSPTGETESVMRRIDLVPWWSFGIARHFLKREARALAIAGRLKIAPELLHQGERVLFRSWIEALPLHIAKPQGDLGYFKSAKRALRALHRQNVTHNDLAKEQNWLRTPDGRCMLTDFQLAICFRRRHALFRLAAYEDLRHLLKHKRRYAPDSLTPVEKRILAKKSLPTRIWMATGKRVYYWSTTRRACAPASPSIPTCARRRSSPSPTGAPAPASMPSSNPDIPTTRLFRPISPSGSTA
jgi:serine/threonine protein kinase